MAPSILSEIARQAGGLHVVEPNAPIPPRPIEFNRADPVLRALVRADPSADPTDVAFLAAADALAAELDQLADNPVAPDALVRELLATFGSPQELVAAVHHRFATQRAGEPGANVAAERAAEALALSALESWAGALVTEWTRSTFSISAELELAIDRRIETAIANGGLGDLLEQTANATDETTQRATARLVLARMPSLTPNLVAEAQAFVVFARGPDVNNALALLDAAAELRARALGLVSLLAPSSPGPGPQAA